MRLSCASGVNHRDKEELAVQGNEVREGQEGSPALLGDCALGHVYSKILTSAMKLDPNLVLPKVCLIRSRWFFHPYLPIQLKTRAYYKKY